MQEDNLNAGTGDGIRGKDAAWHKRRVKRMKVIIVVIILILIILPTVLCILLGMKVSRLQNQVDRLSSINSSVDMDLADKEHKQEGNYAYAAQNPDQGGTEVITQENAGVDTHSDGQDQSFPSVQALEGTNLPTQNSGNTGSDVDQKTSGDTTGVTLPEVNQEPAKQEESSSGNLSGATLPITAGDLSTAEGDISGDNSGSAPGDTPKKASAVDPSDASKPEDTYQPKATDANGTQAEGKAEPDQSSSAEDGKKPEDKKQTDNKKPEDDKIKIASTGLYAGKKVYLTFDDGPSVYTEEILDILKQYDVKATFFVVGKTDKKSKQLYKRIVDEGHTLAMHSYSHVYKQIYNSVEDFDKDFTKLWKLLYDTTGYMPTIYRFPGGSGNLVNKNGMDEFIRYLKDKNILYYDWNVVNGDATGEEFTKEQLNQNVLEGVASKKRSIVLLHDAQSKRTTVESLPELLETLIGQGAELLPLHEDVAPIQQIRAEEVK